jgi:hypothetical protein
MSIGSFLIEAWTDPAFVALVLCIFIVLLCLYSVLDTRIVQVSARIDRLDSLLDTINVRTGPHPTSLRKRKHSL